MSYVERTITEIQNLKSKNKNHIFLLGGDFNLPDINWKMNDVTQRNIFLLVGLGLYAFVDMSTIKMSWSLFPIGGRVLHPG
jgi:hypothetical protein